MENSTILNILPCDFVQLSENNFDCSLSNPPICVTCELPGTFIFGGNMTEFGSTGQGRIVSLTIWILVLIFGTLGTLFNFLIMSILLRRKQRRPFDHFLIALAFVDLIGAIGAILTTTATLSLIENWNRGALATYTLYIFSMATFCGRSASGFITVAITIERYLAVAYPLRAKLWFTGRRTKTTIVAIYIFAVVCLNGPWYVSFYVVDAKPFQIPTLEKLGFEYIMIATPLRETYLVDLATLVDGLVPLPLLLIFNILIYKEIRKAAQRRKEMNVSQQEIQAVKMVVPVAVVLFFSNIESYVYIYYVATEYVATREHMMGMFLSTAINSAVNLPIYYLKGINFKEDVKKLFGK